MEYLLLLLGLAVSLIGVAGDTWDKNQTGFKKLNNLGKVLVLIVLLSFCFGTWSVYKNHEEISEGRETGNKQILQGIDRILSPLKFGNLNMDSINFFSRIKDTTYLTKLYDRKIFELLYNGKVGNTFEHPYKADSSNISKGENLLNDAIIKFNKYLDAKTIVHIMDILTDKYFNDNYKFTNNHFAIEMAMFHFNDRNNSQSNWTNSPFSTYGDYYISWDNNAENRYTGMTRLVDKIQLLVAYINESK